MKKNGEWTFFSYVFAGFGLYYFYLVIKGWNLSFNLSGSNFTLDNLLWSGTFGILILAFFVACFVTKRMLVKIPLAIFVEYFALVIVLQNIGPALEAGKSNLMLLWAIVVLSAGPFAWISFKRSGVYLIRVLLG